MATGRPGSLEKLHCGRSLERGGGGWSMRLEREEGWYERVKPLRSLKQEIRGSDLSLGFILLVAVGAEW